MKILFAGAGEFGAPTLRRLVDAGASVVRVYSQPDRPAGRGKKLTPSPLAQVGLDLGLDVVRTPSINMEADLPDSDAMVVIAFGQKIAPHVVQEPKFGAINLHASLLPKYRGAAPINWALIEGETTVGNSIIRLAQKMDAGAVLGQSSLPVGELETAGEVHDRLAIHGAALVERVLVELREGRAVETEQEHDKATLAPKLSREQTQLDWSQPAVMLCRAILGLYPWPGCRVRLIDELQKEVARLTLVRARVIERPRNGFVGIIDEHGHVGAGDHMIDIVSLQPEGKRPMTLKEFRNGHRWEAGMRLESIL